MIIYTITYYGSDGKYGGIHSSYYKLMDAKKVLKHIGRGCVFSDDGQECYEVEKPDIILFMIEESCLHETKEIDYLLKND